MTAVSQVHGDLLDQPVEAIVNAWNRNFIPWWLLLPQGVSGTIKRRGGYEPFRQLAKCGVLQPGEARLTSAGRLPFRAIIPVAALNMFWRSSPKIIRRCVASALRLASIHEFRSVAIPLIGAGTGGVRPSAALDAIVAAAHESDFQGEIRIVIHSSPGRITIGERTMMKPVPLLAERIDLWDLATVRDVDVEDVRNVLGPPHHIETDGSRTAGGEEHTWRFELPNGELFFVEFAVPYRTATVTSNRAIASDDLKAACATLPGHVEIFPSGYLRG